MGEEAELLGEMIAFARGVGIGAQCVGVPATRVDRHAAARRETAPVAPHGRALALLVGGLVKSKGLDAARVEPGVEEIDDLAFARGLVAGDDEQNGKRGVLERDLHLDERATQSGHAGLVVFFWEARRAVCLRHEGEKWRGGAELSRLGSYFGGRRRFVTERVVTPPVGVKVNGVLRSRATSQPLPFAVGWASPRGGRGWCARGRSSRPRVVSTSAFGGGASSCCEAGRRAAIPLASAGPGGTVGGFVFLTINFFVCPMLIIPNARERFSCSCSRIYSGD